MAQRDIQIVIGAKDEATGIFARVNTSMDSLSSSANEVAERYLNLKVVAIAAAAAVAAAFIAATAIMYKAVEAAIAQENAEAKLRQALGFTSIALLEQASALQKVTTFSDDQINQAQASIAAFTKNEAQIKALTAATLDLASAKGMDLASAAELVAKSFGSSTDALSRHGIQAEATAGSAQRLKEITEGIARLYGGQAAAAGNTFSGALSKVKNAFDDLLEEIGMVITRNNFFIQAIKLVQTYFEKASTAVKDHRLALMELAKSGIVSVVEGFGAIVEVIRFINNGWLGLKLVGQVVSLALVETIDMIFKALRYLLLPLDLIYAGMVKLGLVKVNPFASAQVAIKDYKMAVIETGASVLAEIEKTNQQYDAVKSTVAGIVKGLKDIKVAQTEISAVKPASSPLVDLGKLKSFTEKIQDEIAKLHEKGQNEWVAAAVEFNAKMKEASLIGAQAELEVQKWLVEKSGAIRRNAEDEERIGTEKYRVEQLELKRKFWEESITLAQEAQKETVRLEMESAIEKAKIRNDIQKSFLENSAAIQGDIYIKHQLELIATEEKYSALYLMAQKYGASLTDLDMIQSQGRQAIAQKEMDFKLQTASTTAGNLATIAQALYELTGKKSKEAFAIFKAMSIAQTTIDTYKAAQGAYAAMAGIPIVGPALGVIAAAAAIAAGMMRVQQIQSMQFGGGGSMSAAAGSSASGAIPSMGTGGSMTGMSSSSQQQPQPVTVNLTIVNPLSDQNWNKIMEEQVVPALERFTSRGGTVALNVA